MRRAMMAVVALATPAALAAAPFTLGSTSIRDGRPIPVKYAGNLPGVTSCPGQNISPQLSWSNLPEGTRSIALMMNDPEARGGQGVNHWIAYGIPTSKTALAEGEASTSPVGFVGGKSAAGLDHYLGPCTPPDTSWHHYTWLAIATDLAPDALPAGLTREELLDKLQGHSTGTAGLVGLFRHR